MDELIQDWDEENIIQLMQQIQQLAELSVENQYKQFFSHRFKDIIAQDVRDYIVDTWEIEDPEELEFCKKMVTEVIDEYIRYLTPIPYVYYSRNVSLNPQENINKDIQRLKSLPQPEQKSDEWYEKRHNMITASNMWKVLRSESTRNSIIFEKCKPSSQGAPRFCGGPMEWGNKYEPVSIMFYESHYSTTIEDFGCITHPDFDFIGASPDGINVDPNSPLFGRMLEIKNIYNRNITGVPKEEYWIQMQVQMETCGLEYCDFLETRFKEYSARETEDHQIIESQEAFYNSDHTTKGVLVQFATIDANSFIPHYEYYPLQTSYHKKDVDTWVDKVRETHQQKAFIKVIYYYLEEHSCVLVQRNKKWFNLVKPDIVDTWNTIIRERTEGYDHRRPRSRSNSVTQEANNMVAISRSEGDTTRIIHNLQPTTSISLVRLDANGNTEMDLL